MCGKFTARAEWTGIVDLAWTQEVGAEGRGENRTYRVMQPLPLIVRHDGVRRVVPMRWGFPDPKDPRRPKPIHARGETVDTTPTFADAFRDGQRGIVLVNSFNEAPDNGTQHVITPAGPIGIAFVWRRFGDMLACVMVTVAASPLVAALPTDRMPAVLAPEDWAAWLGEMPASPAAVKACLHTVDDVRWTMTPEQRATSARRARPIVSDPGGLF